MTAQQRAEIGGAAYTLSQAVMSGNAAQLRANAVAQYAGDFNQTAYLAKTTADRIAGDTLAVKQAYLLDASGRSAGETSVAEFACPLAGTVAEMDFGIAGLPPGRFAFAMVEARGPNPWLLAYLLQQEGSGAGGWKMAGFYPHARSAAGHDGLWYWTQARADAKANKPWLAWVLYGEADQLLTPASFASTSNLEKLRGEQRTAAPEPLANGLSAQTPLSVEGASGTVYRVTALGTQSSAEGKALDLVMHIEVEAGAAGDAATERNVAAGRALLRAHPELRDGFTNVFVIAEAQGANPFVVERPIAEMGAGSK